MTKFFVLVSLFFSACGAAKTQSQVKDFTQVEIPADIQRLQALTKSVEWGFAVQGNTAEEIIQYIATEQCGDSVGSEDCRIDNNLGAFPEFDTTDPLFGVISREHALDGIFGVVAERRAFEDLSREQEKAARQEVKDIMKALEEKGFKFGFDAGASTYCGVHQGGALLIDVAGKKVYEIAVPGGPC